MTSVCLSVCDCERSVSQSGNVNKVTGASVSAASSTSRPDGTDSIADGNESISFGRRPRHQHPSVAACGRETSCVVQATRRDASWQRHRTACKSAHVCLFSSPADQALPCQPNNGPMPMDRLTVGRRR